MIIQVPDYFEQAKSAKEWTITLRKWYYVIWQFIKALGTECRFYMSKSMANCECLCFILPAKKST